MGALALTPDKEARAAFAGEAGTVGLICREHCFSGGLVMRAVGDRMIISPPLTLSKADIDLLVDRASAALDKTYAERKKRVSWWRLNDLARRICRISEAFFESDFSSTIFSARPWPDTNAALTLTRYMRSNDHLPQPAVHLFLEPQNRIRNRAANFGRPFRRADPALARDQRPTSLLSAYGAPRCSGGL